MTKNNELSRDFRVVFPFNSFFPRSRLRPEIANRSSKSQLLSFFHTRTDFDEIKILVANVLLLANGHISFGEDKRE